MCPWNSGLKITLVSIFKTPRLAVCAFLVIVAGIILHWPYHNFQPFLAQGDHGRDLYAAQAILRGEVPYTDFWWVYGPLMPTYYALWFKLCGVKISSVLLGKIALNVAAGTFFGLGLAQFFPIGAAFVAALWFMSFQQDFFFTYNHAGGIAALMAVLWMHCAYMKTARPSYAWGALAAVFLLGLIKINFAVTAWAMTMAVLIAKDFFDCRGPDSSKKIFFASLLFFVPLGWVCIYASLTHGLSPIEIRQCLPYLGSDEPYNRLGPLETLPLLAQIILGNIKSSWVNAAFCGLILLSGAHVLYLVWRNKGGAARKTLLLLLCYGTLFYVLNLHEFIKSGVYYRLFWAQPLSMFLTFVVVFYSASVLQTRIQSLLWGALLIIIAVSGVQKTQQINTFKNPQQYFGSARGGVYITNDRVWMQTVVLTTRQLNTVLKKDELFLALPYDVLYYYLTDKKTPTRQLIFFDHIKIPTEQEEKIIAELERHKIAAVLLSSRQSAHETGLGTLGVTYCPLLGEYINAHFAPVAKIGDWVNEPGWAWNHGTLILKRK